jgi:hypothetical protein
LRKKSKNLKHGASKDGFKTPTFLCWLGIRKRCLDHKSKSYYRYGGRGITICDDWKNDFSKFLADMGERPTGLSIERKDNNGPYSKDNCTWATGSQQARNRRSNILLTHNGKTKTLIEWTEELNIPYHTIRARISRGWDAQRAFLEPIGGWR